MSRGLTGLLFGVAVAAPLAPSAQPPAGGQGAAVAEVDTPRPSYGVLPGRVGPLLRRTHRLSDLFASGEGELTGGAPVAVTPALLPDAALHAFSWGPDGPRGERLRLLTWRGPRSNHESLNGFVLQGGESWCSPPLRLAVESRLRFEAFSISLEPARLSVSRDGGTELYRGELEAPGPLNAATQLDLPVAAGATGLCFAAEGGPALVGEARLLAPETGGDARPRWIVFTIVDALRADVLVGPGAAELAPAMTTLAAGGLRYADTSTPGCHTRAALWPLMTGRDLARVDPLMRRGAFPLMSTWEEIWSRPTHWITNRAQAVGYHPVFLGNNDFLSAVPTFERLSSWGSQDMGTVDAAARLPDLLARYGDERVFLVHHISAAHAGSRTPRRLIEAFGCTEDDATRCSYRARVRHADEGMASLLGALEGVGLEDETLHVLTADHGELLGDGFPFEGAKHFPTPGSQGAYQSFAVSHGSSCHPFELQVPLVLHGPGIPAGRSTAPVSTLDVYPTLLRVIGAGEVQRLDGTPLPLSPAAPSRPRTRVAYAECAETVSRGGRLLRWWSQGCRVRQQDGSVLDHDAELWADGELVATERTRPRELRALLADHVDWLAERLPTDSLSLGLAGLRSVRLEVRGGHISDFGPIRSASGYEGIRSVRLSEDRRALELELRDYTGLFAVTTRPPHAPVAVRAVAQGGGPVVTRLGRLLLPLEGLGQWIDPGTAPGLLVAAPPPPWQPIAIAELSLWWETRREAEQADAPSSALGTVDRVMREWGYVR